MMKYLVLVCFTIAFSWMWVLQPGYGAESDAGKSLQAIFQELKKQPYEYEAILTKDRYVRGEVGVLIVRVRKGEYNVAGKPIKIVSSIPLDFTPYSHLKTLEEDDDPAPSRSLAEKYTSATTALLSQSDVEESEAEMDAREALADVLGAGEAVLGSEVTLKTDLAGEIRVEFPVATAGKHDFHVFFLHPSDGYNEHVENLSYRVLVPSHLFLYLLVPWGIFLAYMLLVMVKGLNISALYRLGYALLVKYFPDAPVPMMTSGTGMKGTETSMLTTLWHLSEYALVFPRFQFFSSQALGKRSYSVNHLGLWLIFMGLGALVMGFLGNGIYVSVVVLLLVLCVYVWSVPFRTSLFILLWALIGQYYFYAVQGGSWEGWNMAESSWGTELMYIYLALLLLNLWFPMPIGAVSLYWMDRLYYHSPFEEMLMWIAGVACLAAVALIWTRMPPRDIALHGHTTSPAMEKSSAPAPSP